MKEIKLTNIVFKVILYFITAAILLIINRSLTGAAICLVLTMFVITGLMFYLRKQLTRVDADITGINNKAALEKYLNKLDKFELPNNIGIIVFDLNNLKYVNDHYGHKMGDFYIKKFSDCLVKCQDGSRFIARFGGDEFVVIQKNTSEDEIKKLLKALDVFIKYENCKLSFSIKYAMGYTVNDKHQYKSIDEMFEMADKIMYTDKMNKKSFDHCINSIPVVSEDVLKQELQNLTDNVEEMNKEYCFGMLDIQNFRFINENYGYEAGNELLIHTRQKFEKYCYTDYIHRLQADLFFVAFKISGIDSQAFEEHITEFVLEDARHISSRFRTKYNIGLYIPKQHDTAEHIIYHCNVARKISKETAKTICMFKEEYIQQIRTKNEILASFYQAIQSDEFQIYMQPKIDSETKRVTSAEVLTRWQCGSEIKWYPDVFIPILEQSGDIIELDFHIYEKVFRWMSLRNSNGLYQIPISLNASPVHFQHPEKFPRRILALLEKYHIDPKCVIIEITESAFINNTKQVNEVIDILHNHGIHISMDDFGSGYSSLNLLKNLCFDEVKLDKAFLSGDANKNKNSIIVVQEVFHMLKRLKKHIVCEGVETKEISDFLVTEGCDELQGYYFYRPMPICDFEQLLL